jgi:hypothetical protein
MFFRLNEKPNSPCRTSLKPYHKSRFVNVFSMLRAFFGTQTVPEQHLKVFYHFTEVYVNRDSGGGLGS